jgi:SPP1 family predicted phage head-tail adaptor
MKLGALRHLITIQHQVTQKDAVTGEIQEVVWEKLAQVYASIEPLSARDLIAAKANQSEVSGRIVIRYRPGVLPTMRILYRDTIYDIQGQPLSDKVSGLDYLTLLVSAGVNDG